MRSLHEIWRIIVVRCGIATIEEIVGYDPQKLLPAPFEDQFLHHFASMLDLPWEDFNRDWNSESYRK